MELVIVFETLVITDLVRAQNFPKNYHFLSPDTHTYVRVGIRA